MSAHQNMSPASASMPERIIPELPFGEKKVLLHSCCAPCSCEVMAAMQAASIEFSVFFYNPNIQPEHEYNLRKEENIRFAKKHHIEFIDADYDTNNWMKRAKGMEFEPERGLRCTMCFDMRLERTALYAHENNFPVIATCLGISRWKNLAQINDCGKRAIAPYDDVKFWDFNWRKKGGAARMIAISKEEEFYQQQYCGCAYSLRDSNRWRKSQGRPPIKIGEGVYHK